VEVHADASNFVSDMSKQEAYTQVLDAARGLFYDQRNWVSLAFCFLQFVHIVQLHRMHSPQEEAQPLMRSQYPHVLFSEASIVIR
jgi:hypothetical protein